MTNIEIANRVGIVGWAENAGAPFGPEDRGICLPCTPAIYATAPIISN
jgi:hypothetical protein